MKERKPFVGRYPDFITQGTPPCSTIDPEAYFPERGDGREARETAIAKKTCSTCQYQIQCLEWALSNHELGIWGGTTERERNKLNKRRPIK